MTWKCSENYVIGETDKAPTYAMTKAKLYVPVVAISVQDNAKFLQQLKSGFKITINWNKYQSKTGKKTTRNWYLDFLISPIFQGVNILFVLWFENEKDRLGRTGYYLPKIEIKDYNVKINGRNFFDQPINDDFKTYVKKLKKTASAQGNDYTTGCLINILIREYNLTINNNNQKLFIFVQIENNKTRSKMFLFVSN